LHSTGKVSTYGELAKAIGKPKSARAVGGALKRNPFAPAVPCHRVVGANLSLTGFEGSRGDEKINKKKKMLEEEGVEFSAEKRTVVDARSVYKFPCNHA
jgi:methylated-DNA-[protein]-cysteine S-methyltransferase